jgi:hypothetical protein
MLTDLQGQIERITFTNEDSGYTIAKVKVYGRRDLVTVVGNLLAPDPRRNPEDARGMDQSPQIRRTIPANILSAKGWLSSMASLMCRYRSDRLNFQEVDKFLVRDAM